MSTLEYAIGSSMNSCDKAMITLTELKIKLSPHSYPG